MVPSIKGSAFQSVIDDVKRLVDAGRLDLDDLDLGLTDKDRRVLDEVITPVSWLPIDVYGRLLAALAQAEAPRDQVTYLRQRGRRAAERLLSGAYQGYAAGESSLARAGQMIVSVAKLLYSFMTWEVREGADGAIEVHISDAAAFPDAALHAAVGFLECFAEHNRRTKPVVTCRRLGADRITLRVADR